MRLEALETRTDEFEQRNLVLQLTLGLLSAGERLDGLLERYVPEDKPVEAPPLHDEDGILIDFVLGLIRFRETTVGLAARAAVAVPESEVSGQARPARFLSEGALR